MNALLILIALSQAPATTTGAAPETAVGHELTRAETESLARRDATRRLGVPTGDVRVVASDSRTWPDQRLGCVTRRGVAEPVPVPGYRIVVDADGIRNTYHTDRSGHLMRCETTVKRVSPMLR